MGVERVKKPAFWLQSFAKEGELSLPLSHLQLLSTFFFSISVLVSPMLQHHMEGMEWKQTVQFVVTEKTAISLGFFEINQNITFPVNETVIEENAIIENRALLMGGYFTLKQRWKMADYTSGSGDKISSLEDHFQVTSFRILLRYSMKVAFGAHNTVTENIIQHFLKESKESNDKSGWQLRALFYKWHLFNKIPWFAWTLSYFTNIWEPTCMISWHIYRGINNFFHERQLIV